MRRKKIIAALCITVCLGARAILARETASKADKMDDIPVFAADITDRPYNVVREIKVAAHAPLHSMRAPQQKAIFRQLWDAAKPFGADAVVKAEVHRAPIGKGSEAVGVAIKFKPPCTPSTPHAPAC